MSGRFDTNHVAPNTSNILKILLPTIFPIAISDWRFIEATTEVTSSGALVPNATIVSPIIDSEILNESAILLAEPISKSAHTHSQMSHQKINKNDCAILFSVISSESTTSSPFHFFASQNVYAKNKRKNNSSTRLSHLVIIFSSAPEKVVSSARNKSANDAIREKGISL